MKRPYFLWVVPCLGFLLTGCSGPGLTGKAYEDHIASIKPALHYWEKPGMTVEDRKRASIDCGGSEGGTDFSNKKISAARREGENDFVVRSRLTDDWRRCMIEKGYRRTDSR